MFGEDPISQVLHRGFLAVREALNKFAYEPWGKKQSERQVVKYSLHFSFKTSASKFYLSHAKSIKYKEKC